MTSIKGAVHGVREHLAFHRGGTSPSKAERAQRRAQAEAVRLDHKRNTTLGGGGGGG
jgi:hypothetical protein